MKYTENYGFDKPEGTDFVDVEHFNTNTELMDKLLCPEYSEVKEVTELESGEKLATGFGKIAKAVKDLISHLVDSTIHITVEERTLWNTVSNHTHNYAGSSSVGGPATTALVCTGNSATATKATQDGNGKVIADTYMPHTTISSAVDFNTLTTTGIYHIAFSNGTNQPCSNHGTLFVEFAVGTPYQIYVPDSENTFEYKRFYNRSNGTWGAWTKRLYTDTTYAAATTSAAGLMSASDKTKLDGIATGANKTIIAANLTTTVEGYALDATMGKTLNGYITTLQNAVKNLNYCIGKFKTAKYMSRTSSDLGEVKYAYIPYAEASKLTISNKIAIKFTDDSVGVFNVGNTDLLSTTVTWLTGTVPYVAKTTIQNGTNTLAINSSGGGYTTYDDELYQTTGAIKQTMILEISSASGALATEYRII